MGRALIDTGSMLNMVTEKFAEKLQYTPQPSTYCINTVGNNEPQNSKGTIDFHIKTTDCDAMLVHAQILPECTGPLPISKIDVSKIPEIDGRKLADPSFNTPCPVDMILGIELFHALMLDGRVKCGKIVLSETRLGWMISGVAELADAGVSAHASPFKASVHTATLMPIHKTIHQQGVANTCTKGGDDLPRAKPVRANLQRDNQAAADLPAPVLLDQDIVKFWQVEDLPGSNLLAKPIKDYTPEEQFTANHYTETTTINEDGKYVVKLPRKPADLTGGVQLVLGNSKPRALKSLLGQEKRFVKDNPQKVFYHGFMQGYFDHGHLVKVDSALIDKIPDELKYYLPHHAVEKDSTTTPFRVVVNGSSRSTTGVSLNDTLGVGPTLQPQLVITLIAFQLHVIVFTGDISKMYRQILLDALDRNYHLMLWRFDPSLPVDVFQMHRVSYGIASSCYHAVRTLQEIALRCEGLDHRVKRAILNDFYVDDLMTGAANEEEARDLMNGIIKVLGDAGFPIRKFASNCAQLIQDLPVDLRENANAFDVLSPEHSTHAVKILGVRWVPSDDCFEFLVQHVGFTDDEVRLSRSDSYSPIYSSSLTLLGGCRL